MKFCVWKLIQIFGVSLNCSRSSSQFLVCLVWQFMQLLRYVFIIQRLEFFPRLWNDLFPFCSNIAYRQMPSFRCALFFKTAWKCNYVVLSGYLGQLSFKTFPLKFPCIMTAMELRAAACIQLKSKACAFQNCRHFFSWSKNLYRLALGNYEFSHLPTSIQIFNSMCKIRWLFDRIE